MPARMRILISNDDGINPPGLAVLESVAAQVSDDVWVVAPETEQSGAAHSLTLHRPLRVRHIAPQRFAVDGTPTDCVMLALNKLISGRRPDLMLSGINMGANLADDVTYSGTIAAAFEAALLGIPAIALSQQWLRDGVEPWEVAEAHAGGLISRLISIGWPADVVINVNFPDRPLDQVEAAVVGRQGRRKYGDILSERVDPRGVPYYWIGGTREAMPAAPGTDIAAVANGAISVTALHLDMTDEATCADLQRALS